jgi:hypothetical protein
MAKTRSIKTIVKKIDERTKTIDCVKNKTIDYLCKTNIEIWE